MAKEAPAYFAGRKTYDALVVLAGSLENPGNISPALTEWKTGKYGYLFFTGGFSGLAPSRPERRKADILHDLTIASGVPEEKVFADSRAYETVGSIVLPATPRTIDTNPILGEDIESYAILTARSARGWVTSVATHILPYEKNRMAIISTEDSYPVKRTEELYHRLVLHQLDKKERSPQATMLWLIQNHPFYRKGWMEKPLGQRKLETALTVARWAL